MSKEKYRVNIHFPGEPKKKACFTINPEVLNKFKAVTTLYNSKMSPTLESFMINYINEKIEGI